MDEEAKEIAKQIFVNPQVAQRVVDVLVSDKPIGWSHRSNAPYFKEMYAKEIKPFIDKMMDNKEDIVYKYNMWCTDETGISPQTIYNRVNQSIRWLCEKSLPIEDRKKYISWYETVKVERIRNLGVRISFIAGFGKTADGQDLKPEMVAPKESKPLWVRKMDDWLEDDDNYEPFVKEGLALTQGEVVELKIRLSGLTNIQSSITQDRVAIIKLG